MLKLNKEGGGNGKFLWLRWRSYSKDVTAERVAAQSKNWLQRRFEYCELDKPLFNEEGQIERDCDFKQLATYIYFTETQTNIDPKEMDANFIGELGETSII